MKKTLFVLTTALMCSQAFPYGIEIDVSQRKMNSVWGQIDKVAPTEFIRQFLPKLGQPVHEQITRAALETEGVTKLDNKKEVLRGVLFNDDPDGMLFPYHKDYNPKGYKDTHRGINWLITFGKVASRQYYKNLIGSLKNKIKELSQKYEFGNLTLITAYTARLTSASVALQSLNTEFVLNKNMLNDSHFDDLQFLHSMSNGKYNREEVKHAIMTYIGYAWNLVSGDQSIEQHRKFIMDAKAKQDNLTLVEEFVRKYPVSDLLYHSKNNFELRRRALGSILHLVQDSYAKGHTVREDWESGDLYNANSGRIRYFQDYAEQDGHKHGEYDTNEENPAHWQEIPGSLAAYKRTSEIINLFNLNCSAKNEYKIDGPHCPENGVLDYFDKEVFALVPYIDKKQSKIDYKNKEKHDDSHTKSHGDLKKKNVKVNETD